MSLVILLKLTQLLKFQIYFKDSEIRIQKQRAQEMQQQREMQEQQLQAKAQGRATKAAS